MSKSNSNATSNNSKKNHKNENLTMRAHEYVENWNLVTQQLNKIEKEAEIKRAEEFDRQMEKEEAIKKEAERKAREEAARKAKEEAERKAKEEEERKAQILKGYKDGKKARKLGKTFKQGPRHFDFVDTETDRKNKEIQVLVGINTQLANLIAIKTVEQICNEEGLDINTQIAKINKALEQKIFTNTREFIYDRTLIEIVNFEITNAMYDSDIDIEKTNDYNVDKRIILTASSELVRETLKWFPEDCQVISIPGKKARIKVNALMSIHFPDSFAPINKFVKIYQEANKYYYYDPALEKFVRMACPANPKLWKDTLDKPIIWHSIGNSPSGQKGSISLYIKIDHGKELKVLNDESHGVFNKLLGLAISDAEGQKGGVRVSHGYSPSQKGEPIHCYAVYCGCEDETDGRMLTKTIDGQIRPLATKTSALPTGEHLPTYIKYRDPDPIYILKSKMTKDDEANLDMLFSRTPENSKFWGRVVVIYEGNRRALKHVEFLADLNALKAAYDWRGKDQRNIILALPRSSKAKMNTQLFQKLCMANPNATLKFVYDLLDEECKKIFDDLNNEKPQPYTQKESVNLYLSGGINKLAPEFRHFDYKQRSTEVSTALRRMEAIMNKFNVEIKDSMNGVLYSDNAFEFGQRILKRNEVLASDAPSNKNALFLKYPSPASHEFMKVKIISLEEYINRVNDCEDLTEEQKLAVISSVSNLMSQRGRIMCGAYKDLMELMAGFDYDYDMGILIWNKELMSIMLNAKCILCRIRKGKASKEITGTFDINTLSKGMFKIINPNKRSKDGKVVTNESVGSITNNYSVLQTMSVIFLMAKTPEQRENLVKVFTALIDLAVMDVKDAKGFVNKSIDNLVKEKAAKGEVNYQYGMKAFDFTEFKVDETGKSNLPNIENFKIAPKIKRTTEYHGLVPVGIDESGIEEYVIDDATREFIFLQLKTCKITADNFFKICKDVEIISRYDQEVSIDSTKTSIFVVILVKFSSFVQRFIKYEYKYEINREGHIIRKAINYKRKYVINDPMARIRRKIEEKYLPMIQAYLLKDDEREELLKECSDFSGSIRANAGFAIAKVYSAAAKYIYETEDENRKHIAQLFYDGCFNMFKLYSKDFNFGPEKLGALLYFFSVYTQDKKNQGAIIRRGRFEEISLARNIAPKYALTFANDIINRYHNTNNTFETKDVCTVNELIIKDGMTLTFCNDIASANGTWEHNLADGSTISVDLNNLPIAVAADHIADGEYTMRKVDKKFYATRKIVFDYEDYDRNLFTLVILARDFNGKYVRMATGDQVQIKKALDPRPNNPQHYKYVPFVNGVRCETYIHEDLLKMLAPYEFTVLDFAYTDYDEVKGGQSIVLSLYTENIVQNYKEFATPVDYSDDGEYDAMAQYAKAPTDEEAEEMSYVEAPTDEEPETQLTHEEYLERIESYKANAIMTEAVKLDVEQEADYLDDSSLDDYMDEDELF